MAMLNIISNTKKKLNKFINDFNRITETETYTKKKNYNNNPNISNEKKEQYSTYVPKKEYIYENVLKVNGTAQLSDDGHDRQTILKKIVRDGIKNEDLQRYNGMTAKEMKEEIDSVGEVHEQELNECRLELCDFDGKDAIKVYINDFINYEYFDIGYIPKNEIKNLKPYINDNYIIHITTYIMGGKFKKWLEYDEEWDSYELNYGVQLYIRIKKRQY